MEKGVWRRKNTKENKQGRVSKAEHIFSKTSLIFITRMLELAEMS